jgi:hypothetical protein
MVVAAYAGSLFLIISLFLLFDLLDRTLRDPVRAKNITGINILGALPGKLRLRQRRYRAIYYEKATQYLANAIQDLFQPGDPSPIVNVISVKEGSGKSMVIDLLRDYWNAGGIPVQIVRYGKDFDPGSQTFIFSESIRQFIPEKVDDLKYRIILVEHAPLENYAIPNILLEEASLNLAVFRVDKVWDDQNKQLFDRLKERSGSTPTFICLNYADKLVLESFTGILPPHSVLKNFFYRYTQYGLTTFGKT